MCGIPCHPQARLARGRCARVAAYVQQRCGDRRPRRRTLPRPGLCVPNPYGPCDWQPSQGLMVKMAASGKVPVYVRGVSTEVVGVEDVADAFLLAGECGPIGERYIISETYMSMREMFETA